MKHLLSIIFIMIFYQANAQNNRPFKRLYIGDTVPMESIVFNNVRNYPGGKAKLSDFKGKYIILDFWNKGCSVCIEAFPKMEELQNQFEDDIQIVLVTKNTEDELMLLSKNSPYLKNTTLPLVIGDQLLATQLFPHGSVPFHVWLDRSGKVIATTFADETNVKNLKDIIVGKKFNLLVKDENLDKDFFKELHNSKISLLKVGNGAFQKVLKYYAEIPQPRITNQAPVAPCSIPSLQYYSMFMSYLPGDVSWGEGILKNAEGKEMGLRFYNQPLESIYRQVFSKGMFVKVILEDNKARQYFEEWTDTTNGKRHLVNNTYSYESCMPSFTPEKAIDLLKQDLARFIGLTGNVEERPIKHLILTRLGKKEEKNLKMKECAVSESTKTGNNRYGNYKFGVEGNYYVIRNLPFAKISSLMNISNRASEDPIIIDETGLYSNVIDIKLALKREHFHATEANIPILRNELEKYGIGLREEMRNVKVLVLKASI